MIWDWILLFWSHATTPAAMIPQRKCSAKRNGLYVGNQTAVMPLLAGHGSDIHAKCKISKEKMIPIQ